MNLCSPARVVLIILTKGVYTTDSTDGTVRGCAWERVVSVCSDSAAANGEAHRLSHMISPVTDVVRTPLLALFSHCRSRRRTFHRGGDRRLCKAHSPSSLFLLSIIFTHKHTLRDAHLHTKRTLYTFLCVCHEQPQLRTGTAAGRGCMRAL